MSMNPLTLSSDKSNNYVAGVTIRRGDQQGQMDVTVIDADNSPYDLTNAVMTFYDRKDNGSKMMDSNQGNFNIDDPTHGHFLYKLQKQAGYIGSGAAWFEFKIGDKVDTSQNFYITVSADLDMTISNKNYISEFDGLKSRMQTIVDNSDKELTDKLKVAQDSLNSQLGSMEQAYSQLSKNLQDSFDSAESSRQTADQQAEATRQSEYAADKKKRDDQYTADKQQRDSDFASQQGTINKAASDQRDTIDKQWTDKQTQLVNDWTTKRTTLDTELSKYESTVNSLQAAVDKLNQTDLPNAQQKMDALNAEIKKAEQTFSQVDFSKFATTDELATKADKTDVATELDNYYDKTTIDSKLAGKVNTADVYTKTELDPKLAEAGKVKTVSLNGGNKAAPDDGGNIDLAVPQPDLSGYAKTADVNGQFTTVNNQIKELQSQQSAFTPITQAAYNNLTDTQKNNGMYAIIG